MKLTWYLLGSIIAALFMSTMAFAQEVGDLELMSGFLEIAKELKGAPTLVVVGGIIQAFLLFARHKWSSIIGKYKIVLVSVASFVGVIITGLIQDQTWAQIITDGATLSAFQVFLHQIVKQAKKDD